MLCIEVVSPSRRAWECNPGGPPVEKADALVAEDVKVRMADLFGDDA